jgi:hypothetical protein
METHAVTENIDGKWETKQGYELKLTAVTDGSPENKLFWKWTPSGNFTFTTVKQEYAQKIRFLHDYYAFFQETPPEGDYDLLLKVRFRHMRTDEDIGYHGDYQL